jgi:hypothetical protein
MSRINFVTENQLSELTMIIARKLMISPDMVLPYTDLDEFLPHLLPSANPPQK